MFHYFNKQKTFLLCSNNILGQFSMVHERFAADDKIMETNKNISEWKLQLYDKLKVSQTKLI